MVIDKIYLYAEDLNEPKYQLLVKKRKDVGIEHLNDLKAFTNNIYNNINNYYPNKIEKI